MKINSISNQSFGQALLISDNFYSNIKRNSNLTNKAIDNMFNRDELKSIDIEIIDSPDEKKDCFFLCISKGKKIFIDPVAREYVKTASELKNLCDEIVAVKDIVE